MSISDRAKGRKPHTVKVSLWCKYRRVFFFVCFFNLHLKDLLPVLGLKEHLFEEIVKLSYSCSLFIYTSCWNKMRTCHNKRKLFTITDECRLNTWDYLSCKHQYYLWNFECSVVLMFETLLAAMLFWLKAVNPPVIIRNIRECKTRLIFTLEPILAEKISKLQGYKSSSVIYVLSKAVRLSMKEFTWSKRKTALYSHNLTSLHTHQITDTLWVFYSCCVGKENTKIITVGTCENNYLEK